MKKVLALMVMSIFFVVASIAVAEDESVTLAWEQPCVDGCPDQNVGAVEGWRVYMSDTSGVYGDTPIITMPYDGFAAQEYISSYVLTLTGTGTKYFIVRGYNPNGESGNSNEANYPYDFSLPGTPVNLTFTISTP